MTTIDLLFEGKNSPVARDLKLNLKKLLEESSLDQREVHLALLATARSTGDAVLQAFAKEKLIPFELSGDQLAEAADAAAIMGMLNTYYRFRHMLGKEDEYRNAGLRMMSLAKPSLGKAGFEMLAFAVSVLNGCENCIKAHEATLRAEGVGVDKIHDLARLASVVKAVTVLKLGEHS